jgi:hypothetical protein
MNYERRTMSNLAYQEFLRLLNNFPSRFLEADSMIDMSIWSEQFKVLQEFFNQTITPLTDDKLDEEVVYRWQSLRTEIDREFRLLNTNLLFLSSSRQATTKLTRAKAIDKRIHNLILYCQEILQIIN